MSEIDLKAKITQDEPITDPELLEMMEAGVFYGRTRNKTNPRMKQFVLANRNGVEVINLEKTKEQLAATAAFVKSAAARNASMILLGTQPSAHEALLRMSEEFALPVVTRRWLGGTLTNYRVIAKRVEYFKKLKEDLTKGAFKGYTKKEQLDLEKEAEKLEETLSGLQVMANRPEVLIVIDPVMHRTAVLEAHRLRIPVVALMSTDADPLLVQYPVVGNTKAKTSIDWFTAKTAEAIRSGKKEALSAAKASEEKKAAEKKPEAAA